MAARAQKKHAKSYTTTQRYNILEKFAHLKEQDKMTNVDAAAKVGVPFITLYSWIRNEMWKDNRHTTPPIRLQERARKDKDKPGGRKARPKTQPSRKERLRNLSKPEPPLKKPKTILRKAVKVEKAEQASEPAKVVTPLRPITEDKPIIVRLPNKTEIEFPDLDQARAFIKSL